jgi:uncharacterized protein YlxW (UPF0749 family)
MMNMKLRDIFGGICFAVLMVLTIAGISHLERTLFSHTPASDYEARNAVLLRQCDSLQTAVNRLQDIIDRKGEVIDSLEREKEKNLRSLRNLRNEYEKDTDHIDSLPDDELFRFFTEYIKNGNR